jgi:DNA repair exonuclease SbcCD nuclease subunit
MAPYVLVNDIHLSDRAPSSCTESYNDDLFALLGEVNQLAQRRQAAAIIYAGDVFHHKTPTRTSHGTVMRLIQTALAAPCRVFAVAGNHDLSHDRLDSLTESQPLGVCFSSGVLHELDGWSHLITDNVYGLPWQPTWDDEHVSAALAVWCTGYDANDGPGLVVTHAPLYPPGQELRFEYYPTARFAEAMGGHGTVHYGHVHEPHGIYTTGGVTFCNPGALSRGSLHEHNLTRPVSVAVWDSDTGTFEIVTVPHKSAEQVFRLDETGAAKTAQLRLDQFLQDIGQTRIQITTTEAVLAHVRELGLGRELETVVEDLLAGAA